VRRTRKATDWGVRCRKKATDWEVRRTKKATDWGVRLHAVGEVGQDVTQGGCADRGG
jgi:hypothetical protein